MRVEESIRIAAPREEVWRYVSESERYSEFMVGSTWSPVPGEPASGLRARSHFIFRCAESFSTTILLAGS